MKVHDVVAQKRVKIFDNKALNIQSYDIGNDYPQKIIDLIAESGTATSCVEVYSKFMRGNGFDSSIAENIVNKKGLNLNDILQFNCDDIAHFRGFAIHVNYNEFYEAVEYSYVPFENCRLGVEDESGYVSKIAVNSDWTGIKEKPSEENTDYIDIFNPIKEVVRAQIDAAEGVENYKGQMLWVSWKGGLIYPLSIIDPVATDVNSEGGISNVKNRNVKNNFFPAGAFVFTKAEPENPDNESEEPAYAENIRKLQGDYNACGILTIEKEVDEDNPEFIRISGENYDKAFELTEQTVQKNIGRRFSQPPILRCEEISNGFADDTMRQAYNFYNSVTEKERIWIAQSFKRLLACHTNYADISKLEIKPLMYNYAAIN